MPRDEDARINDSWLTFIGEFLISTIICTVCIFGCIHIFSFLDNIYLQILIGIVVLIVFSFALELFIISIVRLYRLLPLRSHSRCRYTPTCSVYMIISLRKYGLFYGLFKGIRRICRCKPPYGGIDLP